MSRGFLKSWKDLARIQIIDKPSAIPEDGSWYDVYLSSVHSEDFWPRLSRFIQALKPGARYFMLIQPILSSGQTVTLAGSCIVNNLSDMLLLRKYYLSRIVQLEEQYQDTFIGQTRIIFKNIGQASVRTDMRTFSTTTPNPQNLGLDTLQAGIENVGNKMDAGFSNLANGFNTLGTLLSKQYESMPTMFANALRGGSSTPTPSSFVSVKPTTASTTTSTISSTVSSPSSSVWIEKDVWGKLPANVRSFFIALRNGKSYEGDSNSLWVSKEVWQLLSVQARKALMNAKGKSYTGSKGSITSSSNADAITSSIKEMLKVGMGPVFEKLQLANPFVEEAPQPEADPLVEKRFSSIESSLSLIMEKLGVSPSTPQSFVKVSGDGVSESPIEVGSALKTSEVIKPTEVKVDAQLNLDIDNRLNTMKDHISSFENKINLLESRLQSSMDARLSAMESKIDSLTNKFETFIDTFNKNSPYKTGFLESEEKGIIKYEGLWDNKQLSDPFVTADMMMGKVYDLSHSIQLHTIIYSMNIYDDLNRILPLLKSYIDNRTMSPVIVNKNILINAPLLLFPQMELLSYQERLLWLRLLQLIYSLLYEVRIWMRFKNLFGGVRNSQASFSCFLLCMHISFSLYSCLFSLLQPKNGRLIHCMRILSFILTYMQIMEYMIFIRLRGEDQLDMNLIRPIMIGNEPLNILYGTFGNKLKSMIPIIPMKIKLPLKLKFPIIIEIYLSFTTRNITWKNYLKIER